MSQLSFQQLFTMLVSVAIVAGFCLPLVVDLLNTS
ncbi:Uncharacterised protein [Kluyvera cryocrescens]|uniref:Uncharacterized protein n=1 Tax=Kluyvera cryocrescens TaxID=580 RepID=A0A485AR99_KLUCR|nr:Uncharacterised protein [Kluyvera cryocrescens]